MVLPQNTLEPSLVSRRVILYLNSRWTVLLLDNRVTSGKQSISARSRVPYQ